MKSSRWFIQLCLALLFAALPISVQGAASSAQVPLPEPEVRAAVEKFIKNKVEGREWETVIRQLSLPQNIKVSRGVRDIELIAPPSWDGWGPASIVLVVRVNGVVEKNFSIRLHVDARTDMVVAGRQLLSGTVIAADDLVIQKQDVSLAQGKHIKSIEDVIGKRLRTTVRAGSPVRSDQLAKVPVIVNGQLVTIVLERPGLRISVAGKAKSAGGIGDLIRVQNLSSNKEMPARILDASTVEVGF